MSSAAPFDSVLVVSFGGPEKPEDVLPFLENVARGRDVPRERLLEVAEHYYHFGGKSPINDQSRALVAALVSELARHGMELPVYWGNRHWHPLLADTLREMAAQSRRRALAFVTSAYSSFSGCRQYLLDIEAAWQEAGPRAPRVDKLRVFYNHPGFIEPMVDNTRAALMEIPEERRSAASVAFTAHSIPLAMARTSAYEAQLREACRLVAEGLGLPAYTLVYQSRGGPPAQPWLEPDILDYLRELRASSAVQDVVVVPIGFVSDHMEVLYDLDTEAGALCRELGLTMHRAATAGSDLRFVSMIRELIEERIATERGENPLRRALGTLGPAPDVCPDDCCPPPSRTGRPGAG